MIILARAGVYLSGPAGEIVPMPKREWRWVRVERLTPEKKAAIAAACKRFIAERLKPRFLPEVRPTQFNYVIDIRGKWRASKYSFVLRYRSGFADNPGEEFDAPFARLDHLEESIGETRFDVMWHRHTGQWWRVHSAKALDEALKLIETDPVIQPHI